MVLGEDTSPNDAAAEGTASKIRSFVERRPIPTCYWQDLARGEAARASAVPPSFQNKTCTLYKKAEASVVTVNRAFQERLKHRSPTVEKAAFVAIHKRPFTRAAAVSKTWGFVVFALLHPRESPTYPPPPPTSFWRS